MLLDDQMTGKAFLAYVGQAPVAEISPGYVVIMDDLPANMVSRVPTI